jgi:peptide methionine sulfoxide reductase msrA/msrB
MEKEIYFAGGCFWGVEKYFSCIPGVTATEAGYANGRTEAPCYEAVCAGSGHAETVRVRYDTDRISLEELIRLFFEVIDPTAVNRQGPDHGIQYRAAVYYVDGGDKDTILRERRRLQQRYSQPLTVEVGPLKGYWPAEEEHQRYLEKHPQGYCHLPSEAFSRAKGYRRPWRKKSREALQQELTELQFEVTQNGRTEPAYHNAYYDNFRPGVYVDVTTGEPLFLSADKFDAGCGWPNFTRPIRDSLLLEHEDHSIGLTRTEVRSRTSGAHLGHVFQDGPRDLGGRRYCINSAALRFIPRENMEEEGYGEYLALLGEASQGSEA